jgi:hypothetical protein
MSGASERCTHIAQQRLLLLGPARCSGVVDEISSTTTWCLWWRVSTGRASPTRARWKKIGKITSQTRAKEELQETTDGGRRSIKNLHVRATSLSPFISVCRRAFQVCTRFALPRRQCGCGIVPVNWLEAIPISLLTRGERGLESRPGARGPAPGLRPKPTWTKVDRARRRAGDHLDHRSSVRAAPRKGGRLALWPAGPAGQAGQAFFSFAFSFCLLVVCLHGLQNWPISKTSRRLLFGPIYF